MGSGAFGLVWPITKLHVPKLNINPWTLVKDFPNIVKKWFEGLTGTLKHKIINPFSPSVKNIMFHPISDKTDS